MGVILGLPGRDLRVLLVRQASLLGLVVGARGKNTPSLTTTPRVAVTAGALVTVLASEGLT